MKKTKNEEAREKIKRKRKTMESGKSKGITHDCGAQTWTLYNPSRTRASTRYTRPGESIPSALVTSTMGLEMSIASSVASETEVEADGSVDSTLSLAWSLSLLSSLFFLLRTCWRLETRPGGKKLFFAEVEVIG